MLNHQPTLHGLPIPFRKNRRGWIYFLRVGWLLKVGFTSRPVDERLCEYRTHTGEPIEVLAICGADRADEGAVHRAFAHWRVRNEWYRPPICLFDLLRKMGKEDRQVAA